MTAAGPVLDPGLQFSAAMAQSNAHLAVYLNDHLAGAATALEILDSLHEHEDSSLRMFAQGLRPAIEEDRDVLIRLMQGTSIAVSPVRRAIGWVAEKAATLKLWVDDPVDGRLRTFELVEVVALGIDGKRALWAVLASIANAVPGLRAADYVRLTHRADQQRAVVEARRLECAAAAFTTGAR